jgi:outer membrane PBP1 activator LpoA protein
VLLNCNGNSFASTVLKNNMKKILSVMTAAVLLAACGNSNTETTESTESTTAANDSTGLTNPIAIDTVKHPAGMSNQNVISTDTAAMNTQNAIDKAAKPGNKH